MSFDREGHLTADFIDEIDAIQSCVDGMTLDAFEADRKTVDATGRRLPRLSEMVVRIGPERFAVLSPEVPSHVVKGLGNALRHGYDGIDRQRVFDTIATSIPVLRAVMLARAVGHE